MGDCRARSSVADGYQDGCGPTRLAEGTEREHEVAQRGAMECPRFSITLGCLLR